MSWTRVDEGGGCCITTYSKESRKGQKTVDYSELSISLTAWPQEITWRGKGLAGGLTLHSMHYHHRLARLRKAVRGGNILNETVCVFWKQKEAMSVHVSNEVNGWQIPSLPHPMGQTGYTTCGYQIQEKESAAHTSASRPRPALLQETLYIHPSASKHRT